MDGPASRTVLLICGQKRSVKVSKGVNWLNHVNYQMCLRVFSWRSAVWYVVCMFFRSLWIVILLNYNFHTPSFHYIKMCRENEKFHVNTFFWLMALYYKQLKKNILISPVVTRQIEKRKFSSHVGVCGLCSVSAVGGCPWQRYSFIVAIGNKCQNCSIELR